MSPPTSNFFRVQDIPNAGRGVIASHAIPPATPILDSERPAAHVIFRQYRREVCAWCFHYDLGRTLPVRDSNNGKVFCQLTCQNKWVDEQGQVGCDAWKALYALVQARSKALADVDTNMSIGSKPEREVVDRAWADAEAPVQVRQTSRPKRGNHTTDRKLEPDVLGYLLSGILTHHRRPDDWQEVLELAIDSTPYKSAEDLESHVHAFLQLSTILPASLQQSCTADVCRTLAHAGSHNAFGIRSGSEDGEEYMGYGVYTAVSYFNHSCDPNVLKRRVGRAWEFWTARDVAEGEECCITYLGGDEKYLTVAERKGRLQEVWGFDCTCQRCRVEEGEQGRWDEEFDRL